LREGDSHAVNTIVRCVRLGQARGLSYGGFLTHRAILVFGRALFVGEWSTSSHPGVV
jgi:hypothetical protein